LGGLEASFVAFGVVVGVAVFGGIVVTEGFFVSGVVEGVVVEGVVVKGVVVEGVVGVTGTTEGED